MQIKVIVFDFWNTLIYDQSTENNNKIARLLKFSDRHEFWDHLEKEFMHRKISFYDFVKELIDERNIPRENFEEIKKLWNYCKKYVSLYPETIKTLEKLKKKYKLVLLSNTSAEEGEESVTRFGIKKYFDYIIFSCVVGISKPNPKIFQLVLDYFKVKPEEVLMIGDTLELDIIPARMMGFKTILVDRREKYPEYKDEDWYVSSLNELKL